MDNAPKIYFITFDSDTFRYELHEIEPIDIEGICFKNNNTIHREDGPAIIWQTYFSKSSFFNIKSDKHISTVSLRLPGEMLEWWLNDVRYSFDEWSEILKLENSEISFLKLKYSMK